jgi:ferredoxin-NADP reductase
MPRIATLVRDWFTEPRPTFELRQPSPRWGRTRARQLRRQLRVVEVIQETPSTRSFVLEPVGGGMPAFSYRAGQHLTLLVDIDGTTHRRCYSFSTAPAAGDRPAITVKRLAGGVVSGHLHEHVRVGDTLVALEPTGSFTIDTEPGAARTVALVAGGVGITPLMALAETVLRDEPVSRVILLCGHRNEDEIIFRRRLERLAASSGDRLQLAFALDDPPAGWTGIRGALDGARTLAALAGEQPDAYYVCGPEPMMQGICGALASAGVARERVHTERFAYAAANAARLPDHGAEITFAASGRRVTARPGQTILQAGLEAGIDLESSCTMGGCGACKVLATSGAVVMSEPNCLGDAEREAGYVLACCAYADTNVVIAGH